MNENQFYKSLHIIKFFQDFFITKSNIIIKDNTKFLLTKGHNNILHKDRQIRHVFHVYPKKCVMIEIKLKSNIKQIRILTCNVDTRTFFKNK